MREPVSGELIGVFDSGLGGLTAVRQLRKLAPGCGIVYFGDTARAPYGVRDPSELRRFARQNIGFLLSQGAKRLLIACGTISSVLPAEDWAAIPVPCQGVVAAAARAALAATCTGRIGVLATSVSVRSGSYEKQLRTLRSDIAVTAVACPAFVPAIEAGQTDTPALREAAKAYLAPLQAAGVDTVILGCTHYPLIAPLLGELLGPKVRLIDSGGEAAAALVKSLPAPKREGSGTVRYFVSGDTESFSRHARAFLGAAEALPVERAVMGEENADA